MPFARPSPRPTPSSSPALQLRALVDEPPPRPNSSSSASPTSSHGFSPSPGPTPSTLATPWDAQGAIAQLEEMRVEAAAQEAASSSSSPPAFPNPTRLSSNGSASPSNGSSRQRKEMSIKQRLFQISDDEGEGDESRSGSTHRSSEKQPVKSEENTPSNRVSGEVSEEGEGEGEEDEEAYMRAQMDALKRLRAARSDPMRKSISALSGVTVIGKGHSRDKDGSSSTISSTRSSRSLGDSNGNGYTGSSNARSDAAASPPDQAAPTSASTDDTASLRPPLYSPQPDHSRLDYLSALNLLESYPRSSHSPARRNVTASPSSDLQPLPSPTPTAAATSPEPHFSLASASQPPPDPRSPLLPVLPGTSTSALPSRSLAQPQSSSASMSATLSNTSASTSSAPASSRLRKHSRSSMSEKERLFGPLSPMLPSSESTSPLALHQALSTTAPHPRSPTSDSLSADGLANSRHSPRASRPPSFSHYSMSNIHSASSISSDADHSVPPHEPSPPRRSLSANRMDNQAGDPAATSRSAATTSSGSTSTADLAHIMRSFSSRPRRSTSRTSTGTELAFSPATLDSPLPGPGSEDALRRSLRTGLSNADLKTLIQQKRRQASAPFKTLAPSSSILPPSTPNGPSPAASATGSPVLQQRSAAHSPILHPHDRSEHPRPWETSPPARRLRSRRNTAANLGGLSGLSSTQSELSLGDIGGFEQARWRAMRGMGEVVMTPSVEEWRQLGLSEGLNERSSSSSDEESESSDSSDIADDEDDMQRHLGVDMTPRARLGSITAFNQYYGSVPPRNIMHAMPRSRTSPELSQGSPVMRKSPRRADLADSSGDADYFSGRALRSEESDTSVEREPATRQRNNLMLPTLSRGSLSAPTGSPFAPSPSEGDKPGSVSPSPAAPSTVKVHPAVRDIRVNDYTRTVASQNSSLSSSPTPQAHSRMPQSVPLTTVGPIDPRSYSAVTGARNINSFAVVSEAGKGAYGLVRKVREVDQDDMPIGPDLMLKYIVKQRILADAYKRHKVLGVIPIEIHVLDHIRRAYASSSKKSARSTPAHSPTLELRSPVLDKQVQVGHPNLCGMLDFFEDAENYYLVMACFGNGQDLFDYVDMAPTGLSVEESRSILRQIVDAVAFLHAHGIVHRDIKDENIILDGKGGVQLIDFGSAAYIKEGKPFFDTFSGTLDFASPEVLRGERYGGKEADIWALGVLAYVILCGECPFWSSEESLAGLFLGSRAQDALEAKAESVDEDLQAEERARFEREAKAAIDFVHQCLQTHARERPSAIQLREHAFMKGEGGWSGLKGWEEAISEGDESENGM